MRILVTGGLGFIGSCLTDELLKIKSINLLNIDKRTYAANLHMERLFHTNERYSSLNLDICDYGAIKKCIENFRPNRIINLAAETHVDRSIAKPDAFLETNIIGTKTLLSCAEAYYASLNYNQQSDFKFIQVSTDEVYGSLEFEGLFDEETNLQPNSPYAASKAAGDLLTRAWYKTYSLPTITTRCSNNFGPRQHDEKFIPSIINSLISDKPIKIYGDGQNIRDWIFVVDHVHALIEIAFSGKAGEIYNIGSNCEISNIKMANLVFQNYNALLNRKNSPDNLTNEHIHFVKDRLGHDFRYAINSSKIKKELNWRPKKSLANGLKETVSWYLNKAKVL